MATALLLLTQGDRTSAQQALTGQLSIVWGDPVDGGPAQLVAYIASSAGDNTRLQFGDAAQGSYAELAPLVGRTVVATGSAGFAPGSGDTTEPIFQTQRLERLVLPGNPPAALDVEAPVTGPQPWVTLRCRFSDIATDRAVNTAMLTGSSYPSLDEYWRETSYNTINLSGSVVTNWVTLPQPRSFYIGTSANLSALANACTAASDSQVNFTSFVGINMLFNAALDCCLWGGGMTLTLDGTTRSWRTTWVGLPTDNYNFLYAGLAHETGHGFGFPHSSGPYSATYDSNWDVMSNAGARYESSIGQYYPAGTVSYHKNIGAWIPSGRRFVPTLNSQTTISIERLTSPIATSNYLMAQIPIGGSSTQFYTVEFRDQIAHDAFVPGRAVVLHRVTTNQGGSHARVVDPDNNGNPNDAGAMWVAGETFTDSTNGISVRVDSINATSATVTITYGTVSVGGRSLLVNFGGSGGTTGLWRYDLGIGFSPIHAVAPEAVASGDIDANGIDDVVVDFGAAYGLWLLVNNSAWVQLHGASPTIMTVGDLDGNGRDDLVAHFAGLGTWGFYNGASWAPLHAAAPSLLATANIDGTAGDDLVVVFPTFGTWVWRNNASWVALSAFDASAVVGGRFDSASGPDDLIVVFPGFGLYQYSNNAAWAQLHVVDGVRMAAGDIDGGGRDDLIVDFGPTYGVWSLVNSAAWVPVHGSSSETLAAGDLTGNGRADIAIDFGSSLGLWVRTDAGSWVPVHATSPVALGVADLN